MGYSSDAHLCFGIDLGNEISIPNPDNLEDEDDILYEHEAAESIESNLKKYNLKIITHCSYQDPMFVIGYKDSHTYAWRGHSKKIDLNTTEHIEKKAREAFKTFMREEPELVKQLKIESINLHWLLFSDYG